MLHLPDWMLKVGVSDPSTARPVRFSRAEDELRVYTPPAQWVDVVQTGACTREEVETSWWRRGGVSACVLVQLQGRGNDAALQEMRRAATPPSFVYSTERHKVAGAMGCSTTIRAVCRHAKLHDWNSLILVEDNVTTEGGAADPEVARRLQRFLERDNGRGGTWKLCFLHSNGWDMLSSAGIGVEVDARGVGVRAKTPSALLPFWTVGNIMGAQAVLLSRATIEYIASEAGVYKGGYDVVFAQDPFFASGQTYVHPPLFRRDFDLATTMSGDYYTPLSKWMRTRLDHSTVETLKRWNVTDVAIAVVYCLVAVLMLFLAVAVCKLTKPKSSPRPNME